MAKKGMTTAALAKATKRLLESEVLLPKPKKKKNDERENKLLLKKVGRLTKALEVQKIKMVTEGEEEDTIETEETKPIEENVDNSVGNIPKSMSLYVSSKGDKFVDYEPGSLEPEDEGVLESIGDFVGTNKISIDPNAIQSTFTIDLCFFGDDPKPLNKQLVTNYMEKFEIIDYQIPELPVTSSKEEMLSLPMLTHFKVSNLIKHKANFQTHNVDSLVNFGFHESLSTLSLCYSTQIILASQPIELGELAMFIDDEGDKY